VHEFSATESFVEVRLRIENGTPDKFQHFRQN